MKKALFGTLLAASSLSFAGAMGMNVAPSQDGIFVGVGGSYNTLKLKEDISALGNFNVIINSALVAYGPAGGKAIPLNASGSVFAPNAQVGYVSRFFDGGQELWGAKLLYNYYGTHFAHSISTVPTNALSTTAAIPPADVFTSNISSNSVQTEIQHELALLAFIGHSFTNSSVYFGVGPSLFRTKTELYEVNGFTSLNQVRRANVLTLDNFSDSEWLWGAAAQVGFTYYLSPSWFVDVNYNYAISKSETNTYTFAFSTFAPAFYNTNGNAHITTDHRVITQGITATINKVFNI